MAETTTGGLPPVQYLIMETLAARYRLGEHMWTFPKRFIPALDALRARGLLWWRPAPTPGDVQACLTGAGRTAVLSENYTVPDVRAKERQGCGAWLRFVASHPEHLQLFMDRHALTAGSRMHTVLKAAAGEIEALGAGRD
jgi:hypothetical protein